MITALLIGRKGSRGFPGKNTAPVLGKPMAWYPMKTAEAVAEIDKTYLSTDDPELISIARSLESKLLKVQIIWPMIRHLEIMLFNTVITKFAKRLGKKPELIVLLFCNAATISVKAINQGIEILT